MTLRTLHTWLEIDHDRLRANVAALRATVGADTRLGIVVKGDAYGHGLTDCARTFVDAGADWLIVHSLAEAQRARSVAAETPLLICGPVAPDDAHRLAATRASVIVYDLDVLQALAHAGREAGRDVGVHLKIETGTQRQGVSDDAAIELARRAQQLDGVRLEGACTHLADVEDGEDHDFARLQLARLDKARHALERAGTTIDMWHAASSAAALVLPESQIDLARVGIAAYGLWPSETIRTTAGPDILLQPAMQWRARVAQVKDVGPGSSVGYGRTWRVQGHRRRIAILPVGYHEGFPRNRTNRGHVLIGGVPAPVRGRVCMNLIMVEVTDIEALSGQPVVAGDTATLLGTDGKATITAEQFAEWSQTIHYETIARIHPDVPRLRAGDTD